MGLEPDGASLNGIGPILCSSRGCGRQNGKDKWVVKLSPLRTNYCLIKTITNLASGPFGSGIELCVPASLKIMIEKKTTPTNTYCV